MISGIIAPILLKGRDIPNKYEIVGAVST